MKKNEKTDEVYEKFAAGLVIVRSENSNFNADFTGTPRRLPDEKGTIYATDKSLKYCIRKYLKDNLQNEKVFVWRRKKANDQPMDIIENHDILFNGTVKNMAKPEILKNLVSCIDVRLFGVTFAPQKRGADAKNVSLTGTTQISYGLNRFYNDMHYTNQIQSPYRDSTKPNDQQTTIGEESKSLESHYVFDFIVNPNHLNDGVGHLGSGGVTRLSVSDIQSFKEASRKGVSSVNSTTKIGSENELLLYIEYDQPLVLQNLKDFVKITTSEDDKVKRVVDLTSIEDYLKGEQGIFADNQNNNSDLKIEIYYEPQKTEVLGFEETGNGVVKRYHLITGEEIEAESTDSQ